MYEIYIFFKKWNLILDNYYIYICTWYRNWVFLGWHLQLFKVLTKKNFPFTEWNILNVDFLLKQFYSKIISFLTYKRWKFIRANISHWWPTSCQHFSVPDTQQLFVFQEFQHSGATHFSGGLDTEKLNVFPLLWSFWQRKIK